MELETSGDITRLPPLDGIGEASGNLTRNLTQLAAEIANYTLNFLDVGILAATAVPEVAAAATSAIANTSFSSSFTSPSPLSLSSSSLSSWSSPLSTTRITTAIPATLVLPTSNSLLSPSTLSSSSSSLSSSSSSSSVFDASPLWNSSIISNTTTSIVAAIAKEKTTTIAPSILRHATETVYATLANGIASAITPTLHSLNGQQTISDTPYSPIAGPALETDEVRLEHAPQLSKSAMVKVYVLTVMALLSLFGNIMTMWNIYKTRLARRTSRHSWSAIYSLIFHLSIADVLVTGFCIIGEAAWCFTVQWLADEITCKLVKLFQMFSLYLSTYVLVLIGVDRWIAVKYPMKSLNMAKRCYRLLGGTYVLSLLLSLPQFFIFHIARGPFIEEFYQCVTHGFYTAEWQEQLYATFTLVFTFLLPLCILFGTYLSSFRTIASSEKMFQGSKLTTYTSKPSTQTNRQRLIHKAKMKSLRISVVIIFAFLICWTPYYVMMIIFMFWNPDKRFGEDLQAAIFFFGMSNSLVNPLIYGAFHLCPMKRKASKYSGNNNPTHSLNRGDSQRTPSMLTAVTQIDGHGRQLRTYRPSYYRTQSNGSNSKEHVSLLQVTPTPSIMRKNTSASCRNNGRTLGVNNSNASHATTVLLSYGAENSANSTINRSNSDSYGIQETLLSKHYNGTGSGVGAIVGYGGMTKKTPCASPIITEAGYLTKDLHRLVGANENVSSV